MPQNQRTLIRIDPDPFGVIVGIAGILGGAAGALALYDRYTLAHPVRGRRRLKRILDELEDTLRYLDTDLEIVQDIITNAQIPGDRNFRMGGGMYLSEKDFGRYEKAVDNSYRRLRTILKLTNRLERALGQFPEPKERTTMVAMLDESKERLERLIRDWGMTVDEAAQELRASIALTRQVLSEFRGQLG